MSAAGTIKEVSAEAIAAAGVCPRHKCARDASYRAGRDAGDGPSRCTWTPDGDDSASPHTKDVRYVWRFCSRALGCAAAVLLAHSLVSHCRPCFACVP